MRRWGRGASLAVAALTVLVQCVLPAATTEDRTTDAGDAGGKDEGGATCAGDAGCEFILAEPKGTPISIRYVGGFIFWLDQGDCNVGNGALMTTDSAMPLVSGIPCPNSLAVVDSTIYISVAGMPGAGGAIWAVNRTTKEVQVQLQGRKKPSGILARTVAGVPTLYWSENDGTNVTFFSSTPSSGSVGTPTPVSLGPSALGEPLVFGVDDSYVYASSPSAGAIYQSPLATPEGGITFGMAAGTRSGNVASDLVVSPNAPSELVWMQPQGDVYRELLPDGGQAAQVSGPGNGGGGRVRVDMKDAVYFGTGSGQIWRVPPPGAPGVARRLRSSPSPPHAITSIDISDTDVYFTDDGGNVIRIANQ